MRILVAEDDPVSQEVMACFLKDLGHEVVATGNGVDALAAHQQNPFQIVLTDWMMPIMEGTELCRHIREAQGVSYTYIIVLTSKCGRANLLTAMEAGADDFVVKPFDPLVLAARLRVAERIVALQSRVRQMELLLPVCSYCKHIRNEQGEWVTIEDHLVARLGTSFSHGVCPICYREQIQPELKRMRERPS